MSADIDGIYTGFMTGSDGNGFSMFVFLKGLICGVDPLGVKFDGTYAADGDGYAADVKVRIPSGGTVIQGASAGPEGMTYDVHLQLPKDFEGKDFVRVETPLGAVNLRLRKVHELDELA